MIRFFARPRNVFIAWIAYWVVLIAVALGPGILAASRATQASAHNSTVGVQFGDQALTMRVVDRGVTTYNALISLLAAALWLVVPPLVLWVIWFVAQGRRDAARNAVDIGAQD